MSKKDKWYEKQYESYEDEWGEKDYDRKRQKNGIREKRRDKYQKREEYLDDRDASAYQH